MPLEPKLIPGYRFFGDHLVDIIPGDASTTHSMTIGPGPNGRDNDIGTINIAGDHDWFRIFLHRGEEYQFQNTGFGVDPTLALYDPLGVVQLAYNDDSPLGGTSNSLITYSPISDGMYFLSAGASPGTGSSPTGDYKVSASEIPGNTSTYANALPAHVIQGNIHDSLDQDWYKVFLYEGEHRQFEVMSTDAPWLDPIANQPLYDPTLGIWDSSGTQRSAYNDDSSTSNRNSHIDFTAPHDGAYFLDVGGYGANTGNYMLLT